MIRVAALTSGVSVPSARFRVRQHIDLLAQYGITVHEYVPRISKYAPPPGWPASVRSRYAPHLIPWQVMKLALRAPGILGSRKADVTWLQREILPGIPTLEPLLKEPVVSDVDDAIWLQGRFGESAAASIARRSRLVIAGNEYLADWFSNHAHDVRVIPTAIDTEAFKPTPREELPGHDKFIVGWTGSASTLPYLEAIEAPLREFLSRHRDAELLVVADRPPKLATLRAEQVRFSAWSPLAEAAVLNQMVVGIMPLPDDPWTRGKCGFKMLQYMGCAKPVVVSPVGVNAQILAMGKSAMERP